MPGAATGGLRATAARGFLWSGGQALFNRLLSLVGFVVLARLLTPQEYGIVALANVFVFLLSILAAAGYSQTLVRRPEVDQQDLDTLFWIGLATSAVLAALLVVAAWPLAAIFHEPQLRPVLQVLSISFVFVALGSVPQAVLQRRLKFRLLAIRSTVANLVATVVGIAFALAGLGVWSLVVQAVLSLALVSLATIAQSGYRPGRQVSLARFRPLFASSRHFVGATLTNFTNQRTDDFLIGSVLGTTALGVYAVAYRVLTVMTEVLTGSVRGVAFPMFSRVQGDRRRLLSAYTSSSRMCATVAIPFFLFALAAAPEIVHVVFGRRWDASVPVMRILSLFGIQQAVMTFNGALLQAAGRERLVFRMALAGTVLQVVAFAATVSFGIVWVAAAYVARAYLMAPIGLVAAARQLEVPVRTTLAGALGPCLSAGVMVAAVFAAKALLGGALPETVRLALLGIAGALAYAVALRALGRGAFDELLGYARSVVGRGAPV